MTYFIQYWTVYPGSYAFVISMSGSFETGHCSNVSDSGRVVTLHILFDGIPTLTGLEGDMWASKLLTLNTSTSSASIIFDFINPTERSGSTIYARVTVIEVVMFSCPLKGIKRTFIGVTDAGSSI